MTNSQLQRFHKAHENVFEDAFWEIKNGKKISHWMWFIFPQIAGLGRTETSKFYAIRDLKEAELYLKDEVLGQRLIDISKQLLLIKGKSAYQIFGSPDYLKLKSCMTLFSALKNTNPVFEEVLNTYFDGQKDDKTLKQIL